VKSSTEGYISEIGVWQVRHFPRNISQLITGTLSYGFTRFLQFGHREAGNTIDTPAGIRVMQTFKKLPVTSPKRKKAAMITLLL
jgi:hypothetical protein